MRLLLVAILALTGCALDDTEPQPDAEPEPDPVLGFHCGGGMQTNVFYVEGIDTTGLTFGP